MNCRKALLTLITGTVISTVCHAQDLFRMDFHGHARVLNSRGQVATKPIGARDLIATCVGTNALGTNKDYALVYNPTSDSVQVVSATNGTLFCDLFQFQGGLTNSDGAHLDRFNFLFTPKETNAAGTAVIRENMKHGTRRISIQGQIQFVMASVAPNSNGSNIFDLTDNTTNAVPSVPGVLSTNTLSPLAVIVPAPPLLGSNTNPLNLTTNAATSGTTNTDLLALPPAPGSSETTPGVTTTPGVPSLPGLATTPDLAASNPISTSITGVNSNLAVSSLTNNLPGFTEFAANVFAGLSFTNGVICYGSFSAGKNILVP